MLLFSFALIFPLTSAIKLSPSDAEDKCGAEPCSKNFNYDERCASAIRGQISREIDAAFTYLSAASYFSADATNRPGTARLFFDHAREERQHAFQLADYLLMRGDSNMQYLRNLYKPLKDDWTDVVHALEEALTLEKTVTSSFTEMVSICERDWHAADFLTSSMLDEQHRGTRQLAGYISQLKKMSQHQPNLAEYMFDMELQKLQTI